MRKPNLPAAQCANTQTSRRAPALLQDEVLIAGFGRRGHAVGDIPGVRFKVSLGAAAFWSVPVVWTLHQPAAPAVAVQRTGPASGCAGGRQAGRCMHPHGAHCSPTAPLYAGGLMSISLNAVCAPAGGVAAQVVKVSGVSLLALFRGKKEKPRWVGSNSRVAINWVGPLNAAPSCSPQLLEQSAAAAAARAAQQQQAAGLAVVVWCCWVGLGLVAGPFCSCRGSCRGPAAPPPRCCPCLHPSAPALQELSAGCRVRKTSWWRVATGSSAAGGGAGGQRQAPRAHCPHPTLRGCRVTSYRLKPPCGVGQQELALD